MNPTDLSGIIDNGLAVGLIILFIWFLYFRLWPWYTKRVEALDVERRDRHTEYMNNMRNQTTALDRLGDITESFAMVLTTIKSDMSSNHADLVARLERLRARDTGPLGKLEGK